MFPPAGKYVAGVSGGVDSVVLLDLLANYSKYQLTVAHFDHGMRAGSHQDAEFVKKLAGKYQLEFVSKKGRLGKKSTEETAREARYRFLKQICEKYQADGILTAHHFDDAMETAVFNAGRGADNFGLTPMHLAGTPVRPLLNTYKSELIQYAHRHKLKWRDDPSNQDLSITRNLIRRYITPQLSAEDVKRFSDFGEQNIKTYRIIQSWVNKHVKQTAGSTQLKRMDFINLNHVEAKAAMRFVINNLGGAIETAALNRAVIFGKTAAAGKQFKVSSKLRLRIAGGMITLVKSG